ncbi:hypothetical protein MN116_007192 [Schistosoma mekongi]|uniref:DNA mismatch repair protein S5 domain-containing protein n=1 Tax=Schistosoma mekongi TaxID=38744 RepID=A0AAE2D3C6_SCHME|nr:hypothetical protein MN116_007192 [Schistosoma mekongi]
MDKISSDDNSKPTANLSLQNSGESLHPIIKRLPKEIVNRIAAGEVIQRPVNAIKELLENSIDAGSTMIKISVKDGGLKLIQVQDNGCGIHHLDLPVLCERFTTSKLKDFSDLSKISTFGFRGEALASLSHVALVTVITRTANQNCAFKVKYRSGVAESKPLPCAGNPGTTIVAENLFYNAPIRKCALKNGREELSKIVDVVSQYAIHYAQQCGFHLHSESITGKSSVEQDLRTSAGWSRMDAIRAVIGSSVEQNLIPFNSSQCTSSESTRLAIERFGLRYEGLLTSPNQVSSGCSPSLKLSLFINNRLVSCTPIKRIVECAYSSVTSRALMCNSTDQHHQITNKKIFKSSSSSNIMFKSSVCNSLYVYLNIQLPAHTLDVNVHPTKAEVNFLHEDEIVNGLQDAVEHALLSSAQVRTFIRNALPTSTNFKNPNESNTHNAQSSDDNSKDLRSPQPVYRPHEKVRVDIREQQLERFLSSQSNNLSISDSNSKSHNKFEVSHDKPLKKSLGELSPDIEVDSDEADEILNSNLLQKNTSFNPYESDRSTNDATEKLHLYYQSQKDSDEDKSNIISQKHLYSNSNNDDNVSLTSKPIIKQDTMLSSRQNSPPHSTNTNTTTDLLTKSNTLLTSSNNITESISKPRHRTVHLMSILALKRNLECDLDQSVKATLRSCKFIGFIDSTRCLAQYNTELLLIRLKPLSQALFYQLLLANFGNHGEIVLNEPAPLSDLLSIGHEYLRKSSRLLASLSLSEFIRDATATLVEHAPMLWDYFSIKITIDSSGNHVLAGIPLIIANYIPELNQLPIYVTKLATQVSWSVESVCFENICCITANFYAISSSLFRDCPSTSSESFSTAVIENELDKENTAPTSSSSREWMIQYQLWPTLCSSFLPSRRYPNFNSDNNNNNHENEKKCFSLQSCFIRLTSLTELYKVFERC